ncbi:MAG TPA: response regulator [Burkholderiales bacterium]|nr:response regulator [Burkholderiales bacterium]
MKRVLIVDDDPNTLGFLKIVLSAEGIEPILSGHPLDAFKKVQEHSPDLVITDVMMPIMDGIELCALVRAIRDVPVVLITAAEDLGRQKPIWDRCFHKPLNIPELLVTVKQLLADADKSDSRRTRH